MAAKSVEVCKWAKNEQEEELTMADIKATFEWVRKRGK